MRNGPLVASVVALALSVALWLGLVFVGVSPELRQLYSPHAYSRALGGTIGLVALSAGALLFRVSKHTTTFNDSFPLRTLAPLGLLGLLLVAAMQAGAPAPGGLIFDRPPMESTLLPGLLQQASGDVSKADAQFNASETMEAEGDWVADDGGVLQDAVSAVLGGETSASGNVAELIPASGVISIIDAQYSQVMDLLWEDPEAYTGRTVELEGMVYRQRSWPGDTIVVARLSIWCCIDDAAVVGLLAELPPGDLPPDDLWIRATGTLAVRESFNTGALEMSGVPVLRDVQWTSTREPDFPYIFPATW